MSQQVDCTAFMFAAPEIDTMYCSADKEKEVMDVRASINCNIIGISGL